MPYKNRNLAFASIANALFSIQTRLRIETACYRFMSEELPPYYFIYSFQNQDGFFRVIRTILKDRYNGYQNIPDYSELISVIKEITFDEFLVYQEKLNVNRLEPVIQNLEIEKPKIEQWENDDLPNGELGYDQYNDPIKFEIPEILPSPPEIELNSCENFTCINKEDKEKLQQEKEEIEIQEKAESSLPKIDNVYDACRLSFPKPFKVKKRQQIFLESKLIVDRIIDSYYGEAALVMIYAPPCSGKSTLQKVGLNIHGRTFSKFTDTDDFLEHRPFRPIVFTNMPNLLSRARFSIAVVPSRKVFNSRCKFRALTPLDEWYSGLWDDVKYCDIVVFTNRWLPSVFE